MGPFHVEVKQSILHIDLWTVFHDGAKRRQGHARFLEGMQYIVRLLVSSPIQELMLPPCTLLFGVLVRRESERLPCRAQAALSILVLDQGAVVNPYARPRGWVLGEFQGAAE